MTQTQITLTIKRREYVAGIPCYFISTHNEFGEQTFSRSRSLEWTRMKAYRLALVMRQRYGRLVQVIEQLV